MDSKVALKIKIGLITKLLAEKAFDDQVALAELFIAEEGNKRGIKVGNKTLSTYRKKFYEPALTGQLEMELEKRRKQKVLKMVAEPKPDYDTRTDEEKAGF